MRWRDVSCRDCRVYLRSFGLAQPGRWRRALSTGLPGKFRGRNLQPGRWWGPVLHVSISYTNDTVHQPRITHRMVEACRLVRRPIPSLWLGAPHYLVSSPGS